ncbi:hypothetical protein OSH11_23350 [Kaistia dalseonensis]|uniref:Uncharacterized protein n=1 Tax=Kaistia dalseonensis TaxID=410840 RepID=A0ABU0HDA0_9HYPH|nr:hypothetical protein [Kaistia dalseonensis]MCX5497654.1 hypothetical protein [Kaistia dalseonensis]MDQ0440298.1 hypothetical protein [Kaistia dalseonensis]
MSARIAIAYGTHMPSRQKASDLIERYFHIVPETERMRDLAGPNDTLQILLEWSWWKQLIVSGAAIYVSAIVAEAGKDSWVGIKGLLTKRKSDKKKTPPLEDPIQELSTIAREAQGAGNSVILGLPLASQTPKRNIGIELSGFAPDEVFKAAATLALIGESLASTVDELVAQNYSVYAVEGNSDRSCRIRLNEDGSSAVAFRVHPTDFRSSYTLTVIYDSSGKEVERLQSPMKSTF